MDRKKTCKQLKAAKDVPKKLAAIENCAHFLNHDDCLVPLLQLCVPSKKNKDVIVAAAIQAVRKFVCDDGARQALNAGCNGQLCADLFPHEDKDIALAALEAYGALVAVLRADRQDYDKYAVQLRVPVAPVVSVLDRYDDEPTLAAALFALEFLVEARGARDELLAHAANALVSCACSEGPLALPALRILDVLSGSGGCFFDWLSDAGCVTALLDRISPLATDETVQELTHALATLDTMLVAIAASAAASRDEVGDTPAPSAAGADDAAASWAAALKAGLQFCRDGSPDVTKGVTVVAARCMTHFVDAFGVAAAAADVPPLLLELLTLQGSSERPRFAVEKALHHLAQHECTSLVDAKLLDATIAAAGLDQDADARWRAVRFIGRIVETCLNDEWAPRAVDPLLAAITTWTTAEADDVDDSDYLAVDAAMAAAIACEALVRLARGCVDARSKLCEAGSLESLDAAYAKQSADVTRPWRPTLVDWNAVTSSEICTCKDVAVQALAADVLAELAADAVTPSTAQTVLAVGSIDVDLDDGTAEYWGRRHPVLRDDLHQSTMKLLAAAASTQNGRESLVSAARAWTPPRIVASDQEEREDDGLFHAPLSEGATEREWWPYAYVLAFPLSVIADPLATPAQCEGAVAALDRLTTDPTSPAALQPLDTDRFATATVAFGALVPLAALCSGRGDDSAAEAVALRVIGRAGRRRDRLEAEAAVAASRAYEEALEGAAEKRRQQAEEAAKAAAAEQKKKGGKKQAKPTPSEEDPPQQPVLENEAVDLTEVQTLAEAAWTSALEDERCGPAVEVWARLLGTPARDERRRHDGSTALLSAVSGGSSIVARALLDAGVDVDQADATGVVPLARALARGGFDDARLLLARGADVDALDAAGSPLLQYAFVAPTGNEEAISELVRSGSDVNVADSRGKFPLHWAIEGVSKEVLLEEGARVLTFDRTAAASVIECLVKYGAGIDCCDAEGATPLHAALWCGETDLAQRLIEIGAHPNLLDHGRRLPLHAACSRLGTPGMADVVDRLLDVGQTRPRGEACFDNRRAGASRAAKRRISVTSALDRAFERALSPAVVVDVLPSAAELVESTDQNGWTPLHNAARPCDDETLEALARRGLALADLIARDWCSLDLVTKKTTDTGHSIVHLVATHLGAGAVPVLERAVTTKGAPLDDLVVCCSTQLALELPTFEACATVAEAVPAPAPAPMPFWHDDAPAPAPATLRRVFAPLHLAIASGSREIVEWLLGHGASATPAYASPSALALASLVGSSAEITRALANAGPPDAATTPDADLGGLSPLHVAAVMGHVDALAALLDGGDYIDVCDTVNGRTPLVLAVLAHQTAAIALVLDRNADPGVRDYNGMDALDCAVAMGSPELVDALLGAPQTKTLDAQLMSAETRHMCAADRVYGLPLQLRTGSLELAALDRATRILVALMRAHDHVATDHCHPCFAEGRLYSDVLEAQQRAEFERRRQEDAARHIQAALRGQQVRRKSIQNKKRKKSKKKRRV